MEPDRRDWVVVDDAGHPSLRDFVALNDPAARRRVERDGGYFVVEGVLALERLLDLRDRWHVRSVVLLPRLAERLAPRLAAADVPVAVADETTLREVVGFDLHRGALASVDRVAPPPAEGLVAEGGLVLVVEGVNDHENLGSLYRNAAAFGATAVLLDPACADPFYRRSVRVSVGAVLAVPTGRIEPLSQALPALKEEGVTTVALTPGGDVDLRRLDPAALGSGPVAVVVGAEGPGLGAATLDAADHRVRIAMAPGIDSVNVATAAAIALHHLSA